MPAPSTLQRQFELAVEEHSDALYRVAYRLTGNRDLAVELVQETCLHAWQGLASLRDPQRLRAWIFGILRNQFTRLLKRESRFHTLTEDAVLNIVDPSTAGHEPGRQDDVQWALVQLDEDQRLPLLLVAMEGFSVEEAAGILGIPEGTVLSRLHRGRQRMRTLLERLENESFPIEQPVRGKVPGANHEC
jgi:RNA polymerase sigma-70 factor (ECF subfamily)